MEYPSDLGFEGVQCNLREESGKTGKHGILAGIRKVATRVEWRNSGFTPFLWDLYANVY